MSGLSIISLDPGLNGTGFALWEKDKWKEIVEPITTGIWFPHTSKGEEWVARSLSLSSTLAEYAATYACVECYCEFPMKFESGVGAAASAGRISDIAKLTFLVGVFAEACRREDIKFIPVPVNDWKGQLTKEAVALRISKRLNIPENKYPSHSNDAVGIGLWAKGHLHASQYGG